ncbi:hypothetical protein AB7C87_22545 [Natrarchaeobius sp. A-rgal3]|uniref:hypothetical protein n=1 Tax=Natrarchaeobius versutus TaxID=1679078 RepID=UPI00350F835D
MPVSGYDPDDLDDALESNLEDGELEDRLTDEEIDAYRAGDERLVDLLEGEEIDRILEDEPSSAETTE